jgi:hypothetical protein
MRRLLLLVTFCFILHDLFAQQLSFFKEEIVFEIDSTFFTVNGDYYFRNASDQALSHTVTYPLRSNGSDRPFDTITVLEPTNPLIPVRTKISDTIARFRITLPPFSEKKMKVIYRQRHNGNLARYILLTTRLWNKPLENARYSLIVRKNIQVIEFSIAPDRSVNFGDTTVYYWERKNFMPEGDLEFRFKVL